LETVIRNKLVEHHTMALARVL